ncbi:hypothetical protein SLE2022_087550 [Rubroshorea leprosula]
MQYTEIYHPSHPQHKLKLEYSKIPFECYGCKEVGIGDSYRCAACNFGFHEHCGKPSLSISHPLFPKCSFQFLSRPPGDTPGICDACKKDVTGFVYRSGCGYYLHPSCAKLPGVLKDGEVELFLREKVSAPCNKCGGKLETIIHDHKNTAQITPHQRGKGKCFEMTVLALRLLISVLLGGPSVFIAGFIGSSMSR